MTLGSAEPESKIQGAVPGRFVFRAGILPFMTDQFLVLSRDSSGRDQKEQERDLQPGARRSVVGEFALPDVFDSLLAKGHKFVTVSELIEIQVAQKEPSASPTPR